MNRNDALLQDWRARALATEAEVGKSVIGQARVIHLINIAIFARGHVLLEGDVGVGKTTLLRAFARVLGGGYERVEGTIDLMPNDLIYHTYISEEGKPRVEPGPLLKCGEALATFFFNEINRARPQVHSLLLRAMAERSVSAFNRTYRFPHLVVFADRNRVEKEETFEIASAARDRFMLEVLIETPDDAQIRERLLFDPDYHNVELLLERVASGLVPYAELNALSSIIQEETQSSAALRRYALELWRATCQPASFGVALDDIDMTQLVMAGASPRAMSMLLRAARVSAWLAERNFVTPEDVQQVFFESIGHRVFFNPVYELRRSEVARAFLQGVLQKVAAP